MDKKTDVVATVNSILAEVLSCDEKLISKDENVYYDLLADSLSMLDIFIALEHTYSIAYTEDNITQIERVEDLYKFVHDNL